MSKRMKRFVFTFIVYIVGIVLLKLIAHFTNWYHVSDLVYCFAFILGGCKIIFELEFIDKISWGSEDEE